MLIKLHSLFLSAVTVLFFFPAKAQTDTALFSALKSCRLPAVQQALTHCRDINATDNNGATALMWAVYYCDLPVVKCLAEKGATAKDSGVIYWEEDRTRFYGNITGIAAGRGKLKVLQYLVDSLHLSPDEKGYHPHTRKKDAWTPLMWAARQGDTGMVKYLLQKGAQVNVAVENGYTPLIGAAENKHGGMVAFLLSTGGEQMFGKRAGYFVHSADSLKRLYQHKDSAKARLALYRFVAEIYKEFPGTDSTSYAMSISNLAGLYGEMHQYDKALSLFWHALNIYEKAMGREHPCYADALDNMTLIYYYMGQFEKCLALCRQALAIRQNILGKENAAYGLSLYNTALIYMVMKQHNKALPLLQEELAVQEKTTGKESFDYAKSLNNLAALYNNLGQYEKALPLIGQAITIYKRLLGEQHPDFATAVSNLANLYQSMGYYEKSLPLYEQSNAIIKKTLGEGHPSFAVSLGNLASIYHDMGRYEKALPLYQQALQVHGKTTGKVHRDYATGLGNLASIYEDMGQYEKALTLYRQALLITEKTAGKENQEYATGLNNLGGLYKNMGQFKNALSLYEQAKTIFKKTVGVEHYLYANSLNNLSVVYQNMGRNEKALPFSEQATVAYKNAVGEEHPKYATGLINLANLYRHMGRYEKALPIIEQAETIRKKALGQGHPLYVNSLYYQAELYKEMGCYEKALPLLMYSATLGLKHLNRTYTTLSEPEKMALLNKESSRFSHLPSLLYTQGFYPPSALQQVYVNELALKGMILEDQKAVLNGIRKSNDSTALPLYEQWCFLKKSVGRQLLLPIAKRVPYFDSLQEAATRLEQELSRRSAAFRSHQQNESLATKDIAQKLSRNEAAIEFIRFRVYHKKQTDSVLYAALLLLPGDTAARFIPLFEEKQLKRLLHSSSSGADVAIQKLYRGLAGDNNNTGAINDSLHQLIWKPLEQHLKGITSVVYAPAGLLHRVAFHALRADSSHLLIDNYKLNQVLSTRSVALPEQVSSHPATAGIWGNIHYNLQAGAERKSLASARSSTDTTVSSFNLYTADTKKARGSGKEWTPLPGTLQEMGSLKQVFHSNKINITTQSGAAATEEEFKALDGKSPQLLHIATHGFFLPLAESKTKNAKGNGTSDNVFTVQQNPMFRSGLVLAGANHSWKGGATPEGKEDGILTAYEIAQMDLSNTDLVVLSACETALGDVQGNEGVIGLQRAFKLAGVKQMMMSLWRVPDKETAELMTLFYRNWFSGQTARDALRSAQLTMKEKYDPYYWAAFVLVE